METLNFSLACRIARIRRNDVFDKNIFENMTMPVRYDENEEGVCFDFDQLKYS